MISTPGLDKYFVGGQDAAKPISAAIEKGVQDKKGCHEARQGRKQSDQQKQPQKEFADQLHGGKETPNGQDHAFNKSGVPSQGIGALWKDIRKENLQSIRGIKALG